MKEVLKSKYGHIESNFDKYLEKLIFESLAWKKLVPFGVIVPNWADEFITN
jgi:hypothetical protein